jgi:hypothetical protein
MPLDVSSSEPQTHTTDPGRFLAELVQAERANADFSVFQRANALALHRNALLLAAAFPVVLLWAMVLVFPLLPDFVATLGAAVLLFLLPGVALLSLTRRTWTGAEALALGFVLGLSQAALFAMPALLLHLTLVWVLVPHVLATTVLIYFWRVNGGTRITVSASDLALVGLILTAGILAAVFLHGEVYRNQDNWRALAYTASYARGDALNAEDPNLGAGLPVQARVLFRTQSVDAALLANFASAEVVEVALDYFSTVASMFSFILVFALAARISGGNARAGFFAVFVFAAFAIIDIYFPHTYGRGIFLRASEDKMLAPFIFLPGLVLFVLALRPTKVDGLLLALLALGLTLIHPFGVAFAALALAPLVLAPLLTRTAETMRTAAMGLAALTVPALIAIFQRFGANDSGEVFWGEDQIAQDLGIDLPAGLIMLDPRHPIHPLVLIAMAAGVVLGLKTRDARLRLALILLSIAVPVALFFPPTATLVGALGTPGLLWRFLLGIPAAALLGAAAFRLRGGLPMQGGALVAVVAVSVALQDGIAATGYYLGGVPPDNFTVLASMERVRDGRAPRLDAYDLSDPSVKAFVAEIDSAVEGDAVVLVPRVTVVGEKAVFVDYAIPIYSDDVKSFSKGSRRREFEGLWEQGEIYESLARRGREGVTKRSQFRDLFYSSQFPPMVPYRALFEQKPITHVIVPNTYLLLIYRLDGDPFFERLGVLSDGEFVMFEVAATDDSDEKLSTAGPTAADDG